MASKSYPTTLADLNFHDAATSVSLYQSIKEIRRSTLSIPNRLRSILADAEYVQHVVETYRLPVIANERCGSWYIDPSFKAGSAYFKSTDGHYGQWSFSLRRLNLQLLPIIGQNGGAIIVDSTRRGKNMPDAFLKTVPIWVAVMNRVLFPERKDSHALQCPPAPDDLSSSEVSQIEGRLDGFLVSFKELGLDLEESKTAFHEPIRIQWVVNGYDYFDQFNNGQRSGAVSGANLNQLILCSASKRVPGAEASEGGYIQGAGDDSEAWSLGLTPQLFWRYRTLLLHDTAEEDLPMTIASLIANNNTITHIEDHRLIKPTSTLYIGPSWADSPNNFDLIVDCTASSGSGGPEVLAVGCREGKLGSRDLRDKLPAIKDFIRAALARESSPRILVTCPSCKDLSAGVALMLLCLFYDENGKENTNLNASYIDKAYIKKRLAWISSSMPDANPSRATLQSVNSFLMARP